MPGPERVPHSNARFDPIAHVVLEPYTGPDSLRSTRKGNAPQPPRPQNAWILYRAWALTDLLQKQPELKGTPQSQLSKILGAQWANESPDVRKHFEHQANLGKERHAQEYPNYVFKPQKKEEKEREREMKKMVKAREREAEKLRKDITKALQAGRVPPTMLGLPPGASVDIVEKHLIHTLALFQYSELGPSPPMSQCPSPMMTAASVSDESPKSETPVGSAASTADSNPQDKSLSANCASAPSTSQTSADACSRFTSQQCPPPPFLSSLAMPWQSDKAMVPDASQAPSALSSAPLDWSQVAMGNISDIDAFLNQAFPPGMPGPVQNRFEMPSGNIIVSPGFVEGAMQSNNFEANGLVSIPLGDMAGMLDDQYDCDLANPHAEQGSSSAYDSMPHQTNEAIFMQPFLQLDVSLDQLLAAGKEVGNALLDEQDASASGERVMAAEHVQDGAPATTLEKSGASAFLPSPPESSPSATSPLALGTFDFGSATNLCATGSNHQGFSGLGFSDTMPTTDIGSSAWGVPPFGDFGIHDGFGIGSSNNASSISIQLPANMGDCGSSLQSGPFSNLPPTPMSAGPWLGGEFDIGEISMADFSTSNFAPTSDEAQAQKENAWFTSCFESRSG